MSHNEQDINDNYLFLIYALFRIDIEQLIKNKLYICKDYHIQPSEIMKMPYYEYEIILEEIKAIQKEQEKENEKQQDQMSAIKKNYNPSSMMQGATKSIPNMSMPKISIPKF